MADSTDGGLVSKVSEEAAKEKDQSGEEVLNNNGVPTSDYYSDVPEQKGDSQGKEEDEGTPVDVPVTDVQEPEVLPGDSEMDPVDEVQESVEKNSEDTADLKVGQSNDLEETTEDNKKAPGDKKKKRRKKRRRRPVQTILLDKENTDKQDPDVEIEYVAEPILLPNDPNYMQFQKVFEAFKLSDDMRADVEETPMAIAARIAKEKASIGKTDKDSDDDDDEADPSKEQPISKRKLRKMNRMSVAQLKQLVDKPEVVEMHDVTAQDPKLLVHLKSTRNTVPVPRHWCLKRKYLQGKRGIEKPPFDLPYFIKDTGVMEMRQALQEKEDEKTLKAKTRERVRPKMGKLTIDYQKLHDAFFKWQTKPRMLIHGDLYYEGKEFETKLKNKKPGELSEELRVALGMPIGPNRHMFPPPWLIAMQRYGPPPSYPSLKIPGLNAPIPEGCSFGYFVGGWGKPPVDEMGRPLYGDVFGMWQENQEGGIQAETVDRSLWGELESDEEEEEMEEEEEEEEEEEDSEQVVDEAGLVTPAEGLVTPSGLTSIPAGMETPDMIQLRKKKIEEAMESGGETPALFTVLPEKTANVGAAMMGSSHIYDLSAAMPGQIKKTAAGGGGDGVDVALDPQEIEEMGMDAATTAKYEQEMKEKQAFLEKEDLSDMVAEHAARQKNKRKKTQVDSGKAAKKLKEFKF